MRGGKAHIVISQSARRKQPIEIDKEIYEWRHLIENSFCILQEDKVIAMRFEKNRQKLLFLHQYMHRYN